MIQFESVSKTFRDGTTAVDNLSLMVPSDKITVIVGPSGCGKTTTLRMVNRMLEPSKGKIIWDDKPIKSRRKTTLRRQMGYVIQSGGLFPHRTVLENIATVPDLLRWDKQKSRKRSMELLDSVGLDRKLGSRYPAQLSGGQQQRVGVARALAADPLVLLMDEPFSAVDPVVRSELHEFFLGLQRELSKTIIMITHDIDEAIKLGDKVAILRVGGKLAQVGTPQQLLDEPADAFVEGFVGKDRGYRSLSFQPAAGLALGSVQVVRDASYPPGGDPVLVVDPEASPVGWVDPQRPGSVNALGATFDPETDSLRTALDAALTSPVGLAVAVTGPARRYAGVVDADMILRQVTEKRAQIAESIAVRVHEPMSAGPGGSSAVAAEQELTPADDPEATAVRGVPAVESVSPVATVAAVGVAEVAEAADADADAGAGEVSGVTEVSEVAGADWTAADDSGATRVTGPVPADDAEAPSAQGATGATVDDTSPGSTPDSSQQAVGDAPYGTELPGAQPPYGADTHGAEPYGADTHGAEPYGAEPYGGEPYGAEPYGAEPYGTESYGTESYETEAPADEDESGATVHDSPPVGDVLGPADSDDHDREPPR